MISMLLFNIILLYIVIYFDGSIFYVMFTPRKSWIRMCLIFPTDFGTYILVVNQAFVSIIPSCVYDFILSFFVPYLFSKFILVFIIIHSFICSFLHCFFLSLVHKLIYSCVFPLFIRLFSALFIIFMTHFYFIHSLIHTFICSFVFKKIYLFILSVIQFLLEVCQFSTTALSNFFGGRYSANLTVITNTLSNFKYFFIE